MSYHPKPWGKFEIGDTVTSQGRHGVGQPSVKGVAEAFDGSTVTVRLNNGETRKRSVSNLRLVTS